LDKLDRIYELNRTLSARRHPVSLQQLAEELECSEPTVKRTIRHLRDRLGAPLEYDRERNGYYYLRQQQGVYELPGLWFSADELYALLTTYHLLGGIQYGILDEHIGPLRDRLESLLKSDRAGHREVERRIRILPTAAREVNLANFRAVASALVERRQLNILYHGRARDEITERTLSPQRLIYYRDNWYLDAWCHLRGALRSFSLDRIHPVELLDQPARDQEEERLDQHLGSAYGIFSGPARHTAHLIFTPQAAKWIADEKWHPDQKSTIHPDGSYELHIPYSDPTELIMDIIKYGPEVEVAGPQSLRQKVKERLEAALGRYR